MFKKKIILLLCCLSVFNIDSVEARLKKYKKISIKRVKNRRKQLIKKHRANTNKLKAHKLKFTGKKLRNKKRIRKKSIKNSIRKRRKSNNKVRHNTIIPNIVSIPNKTEYNIMQKNDINIRNLNAVDFKNYYVNLINVYKDESRNNPDILINGSQSVHVLDPYALKIQEVLDYCFELLNIKVIDNYSTTLFHNDINNYFYDNGSTEYNDVVTMFLALQDDKQKNKGPKTSLYGESENLLQKIFLFWKSKDDFKYTLAENFALQSAAKEIIDSRNEQQAWLCAPGYYNRILLSLMYNDNLLNDIIDKASVKIKSDNDKI